MPSQEVLTHSEDHPLILAVQEAVLSAPVVVVRIGVKGIGPCIWYDKNVEQLAETFDPKVAFFGINTQENREELKSPDIQYLIGTDPLENPHISIFRHGTRLGAFRGVDMQQLQQKIREILLSTEKMAL